MSGLFSAVRKFLLPKPKGLVGYDLQGNRYFEIPNPAGGRMKRFVEYKKNRDLSEYSRMDLKPPVQWRAWLSHTRVEPPTVTELETDFARQQDLQPKIAAIEAREREERIRQGYLLADGSTPVQPSMIAGPSTPSERRARLERIGQSQSQSQSQQPLHESARGQGQSTDTSRTGVQWQSRPQPSWIPHDQHQPGHASDSERTSRPNSRDVPPPRETIDPAQHSSAEELRRLAMEDTKRRIAETGQQVTADGAKRGVEGVGLGLGGSGGLQPRRRGRG